MTSHAHWMAVRMKSAVIEYLKVIVKEREAKLTISKEQEKLVAELQAIVTVIYILENE